MIGLSLRIGYTWKTIEVFNSRFGTTKYGLDGNSDVPFLES